MQTLETLTSQYTTFLSVKSTLKPFVLAEFRKLIENQRKIDNITQPTLRYSSAHLNFLLTMLSRPKLSFPVSFTVLIQIANSTFRASPHPKIRIPDSLVDALAHHLKQNDQYQKSPSLISHVIWLVMRCLSLQVDRHALLRRVRKSSLLAECLKCPVLEEQTQKGISILLSNMSKNLIIDEEFILTLIPHLLKFTQTDAVRGILRLLRRIDLLKLIKHSQILGSLTLFLVEYMNNSSIPWQEKTDNWPIIISVAHFNKFSFMGPLCIDALLKTLIDQTTLEIPEADLNQVYEVSCSLIKKTHQELVYLAASAEHVTTNPIARRIFLHHHAKLTPPLFVQILEGSLPQQLADEFLLSGVGEKGTALKVLICLKRSSSLLGLNRFFDYKFKDLTIRIQQQGHQLDFPPQLISLWKEVSANPPTKLNI